MSLPDTRMSCTHNVGSTSIGMESSSLFCLSKQMACMRQYLTLEKGNSIQSLILRSFKLVHIEET